MGRLLGGGYEPPRFSKLSQYGVACWPMRWQPRLEVQGRKRSTRSDTVDTRRDDPARPFFYMIACSFAAVATRFGTLRSFLNYPPDGYAPKFRQFFAA